MRSMRFGLYCMLLVFVPVWAQQSQPSQQTQPGTAPPLVMKDPQAVSVVTQALAVAGGTPTISLIEDYTASGNVTYHEGADVQGTATVRERALSQFRIDADLPTGARSQSISYGHVSVKSEDGFVGEVLAQAPIYPGRIVLPHVLLAAASISPGYGLSYKGTGQIGDRSAYHIQVQRVPPELTNPNSQLAEFLTIDFFIDESTFQVLMMQDVLAQHAIRQIQYSDYRPVSGVMTPFGLREQIEGYQTWTIQLSQISFNTGLQDSDFQL